MRAFVLLLASALVAGACINVRITESMLAEPIISDDQREFLIVRATPMDDTAEGQAQMLLESSSVRVPAGARVRALEHAKPIEMEEGSLAWLGRSQAPDASFGPDAEVLQLPSIVTIVGEEAVVELGANTAAGEPFHGLRVELNPKLRGTVLVLRVAFERTQADGSVKREIEPMTVEGPWSRVYIFEAAPPVPGR